MPWPAFANVGVAVAPEKPTISRMGRQRPAARFQMRSKSHGTQAPFVIRAPTPRSCRRSKPRNGPAAQSPQAFLANCTTLLVIGPYGLSFLEPLNRARPHHRPVGGGGIRNEYLESCDVRRIAKPKRRRCQPFVLDLFRDPLGQR
jgi:hypothetical protein